MSLADFTSGFQGGYGFTQDAVAKKQQAKIRQGIINDAGRKGWEQAQNSADSNQYLLEHGMDEQPTYQEEDIPDIFDNKLTQWIKTKFDGGASKRRPQIMRRGVPTPMDDVGSDSRIADTFSGMGVPTYADGGVAKRKGLEDMVPSDAALNAIDGGSSAGDVVRSGIDMLMSAVPGGASRMNRELDARNTPYDQASAATRSRISTVQGAPRTALPLDTGAMQELAASDFKGPPARNSGAPSVAPAARGGKRAALPTGAVTPGRGAGAGAGNDVDFSGVDAHEIPDVKTSEWTDLRMMALKRAAREGVPLEDAIMQVDQKITTMQQNGFTKYAAQGMALAEAGNLKGAMAAYRAAFQYFPSGTDVKLGVHNGHIVGVGVDEKTGKTIPDSTMVLDSERVAALVDNFKSPGAWQHWAQDRREFAQKVKEYAEVDKPYKEAMARAATTGAQAAMLNARSNADYRAAAGDAKLAGVGGADGADARFNAGFFRNAAAQDMQIPPEAADMVAAAADRLWQQNPNQPRNVIYETVKRAYLSKAQGAQEP